MSSSDKNLAPAGYPPNPSGNRRYHVGPTGPNGLSATAKFAPILAPNGHRFRLTSTRIAPLADRALAPRPARPTRPLHRRSTLAHSRRRPRHAAASQRPHHPLASHAGRPALWPGSLFPASHPPNSNRLLRPPPHARRRHGASVLCLPGLPGRAHVALRAPPLDRRLSRLRPHRAAVALPQLLGVHALAQHSRYARQNRSRRISCAMQLAGHVGTPPPTAHTPHRRRLVPRLLLPELQPHRSFRNAAGALDPQAPNGAPAASLSPAVGLRSAVVDPHRLLCGYLRAAAALRGSHGPRLVRPLARFGARLRSAHRTPSPKHRRPSARINPDRCPPRLVLPRSLESPPRAPPARRSSRWPSRLR